MDAISPTFRLDHANDLRGILYGDWHVDERDRTVFYHPRRLLFVIDYETPADAAFVGALDLSATLRHVCTGENMPPPDQLRQIAKDAIHAFVIFAEVCQKPVRPRGVPDDCPDD